MLRGVDMKFEIPNNRVTPDYLNEFAGHEINIRIDGIEKGLDSIRRIPIKTYMEAGKGKCEYKVTKANRHIVARLDEIAGTIIAIQRNKQHITSLFAICEANKLYPVYLFASL